MSLLLQVLIYMHGAFLDLDELIILCKDRVARKFIQEAAACYKAGAYRSCIIATWNAVVFDFVDKLKNLSESGNGEAEKLLENFDEMSRNSKVRELWQFESNIPNIALNQFEFIAPVEKEDIERLFKDRSRCAHPSMASIDDPFEATAELARYHLRSAVTHLLQRPATQGKAALSRIWNEIRSSNFPKDSDKAIIVLSKGALGRARKSLVKEVILGLTIDLLTNNSFQDERDRQFSALLAVSSMYKVEASEILSDSLSKIISERVEDEYWGNFIEYVCRVNVHDFLDERCHILSREYIANLDSSKLISSGELRIIEMASRIDFLQDMAREKLDGFSMTDLIGLVKVDDRPSEVRSYILGILGERAKASIEKISVYESLDVQSLIVCFEELLVLSEFLSDKDKKMLLELYCSSESIRRHPLSYDLVRRILRHELDKSEYLADYWIVFKENIKLFNDEHSQSLFEVVDEKSNNEF
ncbi:hypothetical protein C7293_13975 [filamentous cyanobacterium CCT1]|nr:hypothetical protein C7293_13975 [filamentous cyanobacterium CCT1]PSN76274.1 hypothetical protein C8B47_28180 [filamentous cyanobacterium CCP4]